MSLLNASGQVIRYITFDLISGQTSAPVRVWATPAAGAVLASGESAAFELKARLHGSLDPYVELDGAGIELSAYVPNSTEFDLICVALSVEGLARDACFVGVRSSQAAGWNV